MFVFYQIVSLLLVVNIAAGGELYNDVNQICCNGKVLESPNRTDFISYCCGDQLLKYPRDVDYSTAIIPFCCNDKLFENPPQSFACCGSELHDPKISSCFNYSETIPVSAEDQALNKTEVCGNTKESVAFYNPEEQLCCSGVLQKNEENVFCCNSATYNYVTSICCGNEIYPIEGNQGKLCCGETVYDSAVSTCCYDFSPPEANVEAKWTQTVSPLNGVNQTNSACCKTQVYDYQTQVCCPSGIMARPVLGEYAECCGSQLITNWTSEMCVGDKVVPKQNEFQAVCGDQVYSYEDHYCYNDKLVERKENQSVCWGNGAPYNYYKQVCTQTSVIDLSDDDIQNNKLSYCEVYNFNKPI